MEQQPRGENLSNLPKDIIRIIARMAEVKGLEQVKAISPIWCSTVSGYLTGRTRHPPIDVVRIEKYLPNRVKITVTIDPSHEQKFGGAFGGWSSESYYSTLPAHAQRAAFREFTAGLIVQQVGFSFSLY
ncbi:hypothetical protein PMAYCL1PPCAC_03143, partial [Pristionchus mayeri]